MVSLSQGALIVYAAILNQKLATSLQKKTQKRKKRPKHFDEVKFLYHSCSLEGECDIPIESF